jgi:uncharacterized protein DUF1801
MGDSKPSAAQQLRRAIGQYAPTVRTVANAALSKLRDRLPGATELVYDNYALTIAFSPTDRPSHAVIGITMYPRWINLGFMEGALLDDPQRVLAGTGSQFRHVRIAAASDLDAPAIRALIDQAVANAEAPFDPRRRRRVEIRTVSAKQGPRRPGSRRAPTDTASPHPPQSASRRRGRPAR